MGAVIYARALKAGQKEYKHLLQKQLDPYLPALEELLSKGEIKGEEDLGLISIPMELIVGTRNTARRDCFSASFLPLLDENSEFAVKWGALAQAHLQEGIRDPIKAVEYRNRYYIIEGHKRVSVLRYFGSPTVTGTVTRLLPVESDTEEYHLYQEYLAFYRHTKINYIEPMQNMRWHFGPIWMPCLFRKKPSQQRRNPIWLCFRKPDMPPCIRIWPMEREISPA